MKTRNTHQTRNSCGRESFLAGWPVWLSCVLLLFVLGSNLAAQNVVNVGNASKNSVVFDDSVGGVTTKILRPGSGHSSWFRVAGDKFHTLAVEFDTTGMVAAGFTSADTLKIWFDGWIGDTKPTYSSAGFWEKDTGGRILAASFDSTEVATHQRYYVSFHGSGDPELALLDYVRFYSQVVDGFATGGGIDLTLTLKNQP